MTTVRRSGAGNFAADPARASPDGQQRRYSQRRQLQTSPGRARVAGRKGGLISRRGPKPEI